MLPQTPPAPPVTDNGSTPVRVAGCYVDRSESASHGSHHNVLDAAWAQLAGRKDEDTVAVVSNSTVDYCAVFDGHRGKDVAILAAGCLHDAIRTELMRSIDCSGDPEKSDKACVEAVCRAFHSCNEQARSEGLRGGATAVALFSVR
eukprot:SAG31_NODE_10917_length_1084_cov_1.305584_1_plen_145_part_10